jgi:hypothetical protein
LSEYFKAGPALIVCFLSLSLLTCLAMTAFDRALKIALQVFQAKQNHKD